VRSTGISTRGGTGVGHRSLQCDGNSHRVRKREEFQKGHLALKWTGTSLTPGSIVRAECKEGTVPNKKSQPILLDGEQTVRRVEQIAGELGKSSPPTRRSNLKAGPCTCTKTGEIPCGGQDQADQKVWKKLARKLCRSYAPNETGRERSKDHQTTIGPDRVSGRKNIRKRSAQ